MDVQDERQSLSSPCGDKCYGIDRSLSVDDTLNGTTAIKLFVYVQVRDFHILINLKMHNYFTRRHL